MKRRDLLRGTAAVGATGLVALAGCVGDGPAESPGAGEEDDPTETTTPTQTPTASTPSLANSELARSDARCAADADRDTATVTFGDGAVAVSGAVGTSNPCYTAALADATYDADADELTVTVAVSPEDGACAQCLAVVSYDASVQFDGGLPGTVTVRHSKDGETTTVATTQRN